MPLDGRLIQDEMVPREGFDPSTSRRGRNSTSTSRFLISSLWRNAHDPSLYLDDSRKIMSLAPYQSRPPRLVRMSNHGFAINLFFKLNIH